MGILRRHAGANPPARPPALWLEYPTLTHGDAGMVKLAGGHAHREEAQETLRRHGPLVLAQLQIEASGPYAGAVRVAVDGKQLASVPSSLANGYRDIIEELAHEGAQATIHAELDVGEYVDVWGLCKPKRRRVSEPMLPTQYREDVELFAGVSVDLDSGLKSSAKEKKVRRDCTLSLGHNETWVVDDGGRAIGTLASKPYKRLQEVKAAGLPTTAVITIHRRPERDLSVHVSIPPDR